MTTRVTLLARDPPFDTLASSGVDRDMPSGRRRENSALAPANPSRRILSMRSVKA